MNPNSLIEQSMGRRKVALLPDAAKRLEEKLKRLEEELKGLEEERNRAEQERKRAEEEQKRSVFGLMKPKKNSELPRKRSAEASLLEECRSEAD